MVVIDPSLVLMIGAAGSGKSTLAARLFPAEEILSSDAFRAVVSGDAADQSASGAAFAILHRRLAERLAARRLTVVDATNVRRQHRRPLLRAASGAGVPVAAIVLDLPPDLIIARDLARERVVGRAVIERQLVWLRETVDRRVLEDEGVEPVVVLRDGAEVDRLSVVRRTTTGS